MPWYEGLELGSAAFEIAQSAETRIRVLAGPGAGKSFAMKRRVARLLEDEGVHPDQLLPVTFTRVAAEDLHRELVSLQVAGANQLKGRTLHSLAMTILMRQHVLAVLARTPRTLNQFEVDPLLEDLDAHFGNKRERKRRLEAYLSRASQMLGDWVIFMEPVKAGRKGYHAVGKVEQVTPDPRNAGMHLAIIDPTSYLEFDRNVPFQVSGDYPERSVLNDAGKVSGRAQSAVRTIPDTDFNRIIALGLDAGEELLPRSDLETSGHAVTEEQIPYQFEQDRTQMLALRTVRDRIFRTVVLKAYDRRCAFTGFQFINGGGRAEVEAAHIKSVSAKGPDVVQNGFALSGTVHWMFDRGLLTVSDDSRILMSNQINDVDGVRKILLPNGLVKFPENPKDRPDPKFLQWHRENCFKGVALN